MHTAPDLPAEILSLVFSYLSLQKAESTLYATALVSRAWYSSTIEFLYCAPEIRGYNFDAFVRSVCPSINAHVRVNGLAKLIRKLDLSFLVHNCSKSLTARLLGRVKDNVEEFVAPQASFGVNCLAALSKCSRLQRLDLHWVSEGIPLLHLLRSIQDLDKLVTLCLPRAASYAIAIHQGRLDSAVWPKNLKKLQFNGNFLHSNSDCLDSIPSSLSVLYFEHFKFPTCNVQYQVVESFFEKKGSQLRFLHLGFNQESSGWTHLFSIGEHCVHLQHLRLSITLGYSLWKRLIETTAPNSNEVFFPSLQILEIDRVDINEHLLIPYLQTMTQAFFDRQETTPSLRKLLLHGKYKWTGYESTTGDLGQIDDLFKALAREDGENAPISEEEAGVAFLGN